MKRWLLVLCAVALPSCGAVKRPDTEFVETVEVLPLSKEEVPSLDELDLPAKSVLEATDVEKDDLAPPAAEDFAATDAAPETSSETPPVAPSRVHTPEAKREFRYVWREGMPMPQFNMVPPGHGVRIEASSWEELVEKAKPTLLLGDWEMLWVERDGKRWPYLRFVIERALVVVPEDSEPRWVLMTGHGAYPWPGDFPYRTVSRLGRRPVSDAGPGNYAVVASRGPEGQKLYEVGRSRGPSGTGNVITGRRFYILSDQHGRWQFIGEGPEERSGNLGYAHSYLYMVRSTVHWTGQEEAPVRVEFTRRCSDHQTKYGRSEVPSRVVHRDLVLEGEPPASLREDKQRYALVERGETLDDVVYRQAVWSSGWRWGQDEQNAAVLAVWRDAMLQLNPGLDPAELQEGTRIELPTFREITDGGTL